MDKLDTPVVRNIVKMMSDLQLESLVGKVTEGFRLPKEFTKAIKLINKASDLELKTLLSGQNSAALRGMLLVGAVADKEGMRRLLNYQGSVNITNDALFNSLNKLNEITDLVDGADLPAIREGLGKVFRQLQAGEGTTAFNKSHGAASEIYELAYQLQNGAKLTGVQVTERISSNVRNLGRRVYDYQLKVGADIINYDKKAWTPNDIKDRLRKSLKFTAASAEDATSQFGQLYKDIVKSHQGGFGKYVWVFDQRMLDAYCSGQLNLATLRP